MLLYNNNEHTVASRSRQIKAELEEASNLPYVFVLVEFDCIQINEGHGLGVLDEKDLFAMEL